MRAELLLLSIQSEPGDAGLPDDLVTRTQNELGRGGQDPQLNGD